MPFKPGQNKVAGRTKGTKNKKTLFQIPLIEQLEKFNFDIVEEVTVLYPDLPPIDRAVLLMKLFEFIFPKKKHISVEEAQQVLSHDLATKGIAIGANNESIPAAEESSAAEDKPEIPF